MPCNVTRAKTLRDCSPVPNALVVDHFSVAANDVAEPKMQRGAETILSRAVSQ